MSPRRAALRGMVGVIALAGIGEAIAAKLAKADVKYQDKPNASKECDDCIRYVLDPQRKGRGTSQAFTPKPKTGSSA